MRKMRTDDGLTDPVSHYRTRAKRFQSPTLGRNTGGTFVEKCCHFFDLMRLITASEPLRVYASAGMDVNHLDEEYGGERPDILENGFVTVDFASGARALLDLCMFAEASRNEQEIAATGEAGRVE
jgi:predicted dehydrogenase